MSLKIKYSFLKKNILYKHLKIKIESFVYLLK